MPPAYIIAGKTNHLTLSDGMIVGACDETKSRRY
jgi:hypothetical protein